MPDPKLLTAIEEIKDVLKKHDIAAVVFLGSQSHTQYLLHINPTWSCASLEGGGNVLRFRAKRKDFPSAEAHEQCIADSVGMIFGFKHAMSEQINVLQTIEQVLREHFDVTHTSTEEKE
jgi:hypothetical protein